MPEASSLAVVFANYYAQGGEAILHSRFGNLCGSGATEYQLGIHPG